MSSAAESFYVPVLDSTLTAAQIAFQDTSIGFLPSWEDRIEFDMPLHLAEKMFRVYVSDDNMSDVDANDLLFRTDWNGYTSLSDHEKANLSVLGSNFMVRANCVSTYKFIDENFKSLPDNQLRFIAEKLCGTPLAVDLFTGEEAFRDSLNTTIKNSIKNKLEGYFTKSELDPLESQNPASNIFKKMFQTRKERFNLLHKVPDTLKINNSGSNPTHSACFLPFVENDRLQFIITVNTLDAQKNIIPNAAALPPVNYLIVANLKNTNATYSHVWDTPEIQTPLLAEVNSLIDTAVGRYQTRSTNYSETTAAAYDDQKQKVATALKQINNKSVIIDKNVINGALIDFLVAPSPTEAIITAKNNASVKLDLLKEIYSQSELSALYTSVSTMYSSSVSALAAASSNPEDPNYNENYDRIQRGVQAQFYMLTKIRDVITTSPIPALPALPAGVTAPVL
jgi:hypothetical protein